MIKIIIVDDEKVSLRAMGQYITHSRRDVEVVGLFENMQDAIDFLSSHSVDLVISDIRMPAASGIDLARYIQAHYPEIKMVFISAYRDFEYAQQAISLNVKDYLSKPVDISELSAMLERMVTLIESEQQTRLREKTKVMRYDNLLSWAKTDMYADILSGLLTVEQEIKNHAENIELSDIEMNACHGVVVTRCEKITDFPKGWNEYYHFVANLMREFKCIDDYVFVIKHENEITMVIRFKPELSLESAKVRLEHDCALVQKNCAEVFSVRLLFNTSYLCSSLYELRGYQNAWNNLQLFKMKFQELSSSIFSGNTEKVNEIFESISSYTHTLEPESAKDVFVEMITNIKESFELSGIENGSLFEVEPLLACSDKSELSATAASMLSKIQSFQRASALGLESLTIQKAKEFVKANYMHDIMLEDVANHVNLSNFYFSKFFKTKTGISLTDYIISVRMKAAIELFKSGQYKIYEISEMCGYKSRKYFSHAFKQYTGYTPSEYQRMLNLLPGGFHNDDA